MCLCCEDLFCLLAPPREAGFILRNAMGQKCSELPRHIEVGGDGQAHHEQQDVNPHFVPDWLSIVGVICQHTGRRRGGLRTVRRRMTNDALAVANRRKPEDAPTQPHQIIFLSRGLVNHCLSDFCSNWLKVMVFDDGLGRGRPFVQGETRRERMLSEVRLV